MPEIVQEIGSYAGLAAVAGLAVLSVLYFSQARDVKRLREWAGRAPERAADPGAQPTVVPGRVQAQPQTAKPAQAAQPGQQAQPAAKPGAPAVAAAAGAGAATATQAKPAQAGGNAGGTTPAAPASPTAKPGDAKEPAKSGTEGGAAKAPTKPDGSGGADGSDAEPQEAASSDDSSKEAAPAASAGSPPAAAAPPAGDAVSTPAASAGAPAVPAGPGGPATPAGGRPAGAPPVPPARSGQRAPVRPMLPPRPMPQQTAIIPPQRRAPWYRRLLANPRYLVLAVAGLLIFAGAAVFLLDQISGNESGSPSSNRATATGGGDGGQSGDTGGGNTKPAVVPGNVTVAVLNGTTVPGLAKQVGDQVEAKGFRLGTVANTADQEQQRAESVVLFAPGHVREARAVNKRLGIGQREQIDAASQELAGDATVVVIAGADLSQ